METKIERIIPADRELVIETVVTGHGHNQRNVRFPLSSVTQLLQISNFVLHAWHDVKKPEGRFLKVRDVPPLWLQEAAGLSAVRDYAAPDEEPEIMIRVSERTLTPTQILSRPEFVMLSATEALQRANQSKTQVGLDSILEPYLRELSAQIAAAADMQHTQLVVELTGLEFTSSMNIAQAIKKVLARSGYRTALVTHGYSSCKLEVRWGPMSWRERFISAFWRLLGFS